MWSHHSRSKLLTSALAMEKQALILEPEKQMSALRNKATGLLLTWWAYMVKLHKQLTSAQSTS